MVASVSQHEMELQHYWRSMQEAGKVFPAFDARDEIDLIAKQTEWPKLREMAQRNLGRFDFRAR
jgi:hypothetical protein